MMEALESLQPLMNDPRSASVVWWATAGLVWLGFSAKILRAVGRTAMRTAKAVYTRFKGAPVTLDPLTSDLLKFLDGEAVLDTTSPYLQIVTLGADFRPWVEDDHSNDTILPSITVPATTAGQTSGYSLGFVASGRRTKKKYRCDVSVGKDRERIEHNIPTEAEYELVARKAYEVFTRLKNESAKLERERVRLKIHGQNGQVPAVAQATANPGQIPVLSNSPAWTGPRRKG